MHTVQPTGNGLPAALVAAALDPQTAAYAHNLTAAGERPAMTQEERDFVRDRVPLGVFYAHYLAADRATAAANGRIARGTLSKERQALARWVRFSRPANWTDGEWTGVPVGAMTARHIANVVEQMGKELGPATVRSTWNHLRAILRAAAAWGVIAEAPRPEIRFRQTERPVTIYQPEQIEAAYRALAPAPDLQAAFVLAINAGPRPVDLFTLRWENFLDGDRPTLSFRSRKTGKAQTIPLAPVTAAHIRRLPRSGAYLFPGRSLPESGDPERSRPARSRRDELARLIATVGLSFPKPFQAARATCNTRLNTVRDGAGVWVLGHGLTLNARSYMEPTELVWAAVLAVPQPKAFLTILD